MPRNCNNASKGQISQRIMPATLFCAPVLPKALPILASPWFPKG